jgi:peptidoglycan-associated lipoprotein
LPFGDPLAYSVMHPAVNNDGTLIVFSSDKQGGTGRFDLYYSKRENKNKPWNQPSVIPGKVNTPGNEVFPSIASDGYLYYSSDAKEGLGGLDIYKIKLEDAIAGTGEPEHLPYPVNSTGDDFSWTQAASGKLAYFSSDRLSNEDNIYSARYIEKPIKKPEQITYTLEGLVLDRKTKRPFKGAKVFLWNKCDNKVYVTWANRKGVYTYPVNQTCEVVVLGTEKDNDKDCFSMKVHCDEKSKSIQKAPRNLYLGKLKTNTVWVFHNIHYDFDKWDIRADARPILDSIVACMKINPIKIEIGAHTDARGSDTYNDNLSQKRAESAMAYIVSKGINANRINAKGYGKRKLLFKCDGSSVPCTETIHQENRRLEVKITFISKSYTSFDPSQFSKGQVIELNQLPAGFFNNCK